MKHKNPTAKGRWSATLGKVLPTPTTLPLENLHAIGPFENAEFQGLLTSYSPEQNLDLSAVHQGKAGEIAWQPLPGLAEVLSQTTDLSAWLTPEPWSVMYFYAEVTVETAQVAQLLSTFPMVIWAWANGDQVHSPMFPPFEHPREDQINIALRPGTNTILIKCIYMMPNWMLDLKCESLGTKAEVIDAIESVIKDDPSDLIRIHARFALAEVHALFCDEKATPQALDAIRQDPMATRWDKLWTDALTYQQATTGSFLPFNDVPVPYEPVTDVESLPTFWPQSPAPRQDLLVWDVSELSPQEEFAATVLQGLVNRKKPSLYLLHTRYARQDGEWLDELHFEGYTSRKITKWEVESRFGYNVRGAVIYDGSIMDEIGSFHSDQLNQTNVLMMICALKDAVPLTPEMNAEYQLPVLFDARGKWSSQYEMMQWAYQELFPKMDQRILATNYPGIFLLTDYLVAHKIFTFWFPNQRTLPEENLLRGILASTPPNTPIVGWWFDWMPNPKNPELRHADAVMELPGLLRGSSFGKILTPSHEATNLTIHSGVPVGDYRHKEPDAPEFDPGKVYFTHIFSDGDNLGEALMMRTRHLHWDKPERGSVPMGWSFAPAAARMAPAVLNYYMRTAKPNDLLVGGLGVGYTEPRLYLRAYPEQREALYAEYTRMTDEAMSWIDTSCLWLIGGGDEEEDRYAAASSGQLQGIFTGYGGSPEIAKARRGPNDVIAFRSATGEFKEDTEDEMIEKMVAEIRQAAGDTRPNFIESWVLNWNWRMDMLLEVQKRLGSDFVAVRPDVLVKYRQQWKE